MQDSEKTEAGDHRTGFTFHVWQILVAVACKASATDISEPASLMCSQAAHGCWLERLQHEEQKVRGLQTLRQNFAAGLSMMRGATQLGKLHFCHCEHDEQIVRGLLCSAAVIPYVEVLGNALLLCSMTSNCWLGCTRSLLGRWQVQNDLPDAARLTACSSCVC